jgi:hypothetical protein
MLRKNATEMIRSVQGNATWQSSSEYCNRMLPSGRTMNYASFAQKIQIPGIFGSYFIEYMYSVSTVEGRFPTRQCMKLHSLCTTHFHLTIQLLVKYNYTLIQNYISSFWTINQWVRETRRHERKHEDWFYNSSPHYHKS